MLMDELLQATTIQGTERVGGDQHPLEIAERNRRGDVDHGPGGAGAGDCPVPGSVAGSNPATSDDEPVTSATAVDGHADVRLDGRHPCHPEQHRGREAEEKRAGPAGEHSGEPGVVNIVRRRVRRVDAGMEPVEATLTHSPLHSARGEPAGNQLAERDQVALVGRDRVSSPSRSRAGSNRSLRWVSSRSPLMPRRSQHFTHG